MFHRLTSGRLSGDLRGIRSALTGAFKSLSTSTTPRDNVTIGVGQGHNCIIKCCLNMGLSTRNGFAFTPPWFACRSLFVSCCHSSCNSSPALLLSYGFFLTSYSSLWSAPRTRIRASTLTTNRKVTAMPHTTITADLNQPFDVHVHFAAQISLDFIFAVDHFA